MVGAHNRNEPEGPLIFDPRDQENWHKGCYELKETL